MAISAREKQAVLDNLLQLKAKAANAALEYAEAVTGAAEKLKVSKAALKRVITAMAKDTTQSLGKEAHDIDELLSSGGQ